MPTITHRLMVSPQLFDVATRAIRAYSLANGRFGSVNAVAEWAVNRIKKRCFVLEHLIDMLDCAEVAGPIGVTLKVDQSWTEQFQNVKRGLESQLGRAVTARHVLCVLLNFALENLEPRQP